MRLQTLCSAVVVCFVLSGYCTYAQSLRNIPPELDANFWGRAHRSYVATILETKSSTNASGATQEEISRGKYYRDDAGRERSEWFDGHGGLRAVMLRDPSQTSAVFMRPVQKTADVLFTPQIAPPPPGNGWNVEGLEAKTIAGIRAAGERFSRTIPAESNPGGEPVMLVEEVWFSEELGIVLEQTIDDSQTGRTTRIVTQLEQVEPGRALFDVPGDYAVHRFPAGGH